MAWVVFLLKTIKIFFLFFLGRYTFLFTVVFVTESKKQTNVSPIYLSPEEKKKTAALINQNHSEVQRLQSKSDWHTFPAKHKLILQPAVYILAQKEEEEKKSGADFRLTSSVTKKFVCCSLEKSYRSHQSIQTTNITMIYLLLFSWTAASKMLFNSICSHFCVYGCWFFLPVFSLFFIFSLLHLLEPGRLICL